MYICEVFKMAVTIKDVAARAGVNPSTVSRVLAESPLISEETKERVRMAIKELGYHPNAIARSLAMSSSRTIGLVISRPTEQAFANPFFPEVIRGIGTVLEREGYHLMLEMASDAESEGRTTLQMLKSRRVDGVILTSSRIGDRLISRLIEENLPFVLIGRPIDREYQEVDPVLWVDNDNVQVGYMATEHLILNGRKDIAMVNGPRDLVVSYDRFCGYRKAMHMYGREIRDEFLINVTFTEDGGIQAAEHFIKSGRMPDAIFAADDSIALGAIMRLKEQGITVPDDVAVVGVNDSPIGRVARPSLTTMSVEIFDMGVRAAEMLIERINDGDIPSYHIVFPSELIVRESSTALKAE
ncbi:LacI family transcriptional regulator [Calorimonas adulescens]|jgi:family./Bacterial regulatory proteins, lacI family.|uniref:LacI family transcriptional regulator n=2 Tax=Calorimonas adulescens TaxID=2606906 RepID=A0A5D8QFS6_9THEO|nr:LacI family transcriptional regulator [Calorimonas adulescens]